MTITASADTEKRLLGKNAVWFLSGLCIFLYLFFLNATVDLRGFNTDDPAAYLGRAISLWRGHGYGEMFAYGFFPVTIQTPGFSLLLAPIVGLFGANFVALKLFMVLTAGLMAMAAYHYFRYFLPVKDDAPWATILLMASPVVFGLSHRILAEIPLTIFIMLALTHLDGYLKEGGNLLNRRLVWSAACLIVAYFFKPTSISVFVGGLLLGFHPRFRTVATWKKIFFCGFLVAVPIVVWKHYCSTVPHVWFWTTSEKDLLIYHFPGGPEHGLLTVSDWMMRIRHNIVWGMAGNIGTAIVAPLFFIQAHMIGFLLGMAVVIGMGAMWAVSFRDAPSVQEGFVLFGLTILMLVSEGLAVRYMEMFYPVFIVYAFRAGSRFMPRGLLRSTARTLLGFAVVTTTVTAIDQHRRPFGNEVLAAYVDLANNAKRQFPADSLCFAPLTSHWQAMTLHLCGKYDHDGSLTPNKTDKSYYVIPTETGIQASAQSSLEDKGVMRAAMEIQHALREMGVALTTAYRNKYFALVSIR